jgi:lysozyme
MDDLTQLLVRHEGLRLKPYRDSAGLLTLGVGRNLDQVGISQPEALFLLQNDIDRVKAELNQALPWWVKLDWIRQAVLIDMGFNLGVLTPPLTAKLLTFTTTLDLIENGWYNEAANHMLASKWAQQVGARAIELAGMMRTGRWNAPEQTT